MPEGHTPPGTDLSLSKATIMVTRFTPTYRVIKTLGAGSYGQVFLLRDHLKEVAVKIIPLTYRTTAGQPADPLQRLAGREWHRITSGSELPHHPALVRVREFFRWEEPDELSLVAEYGLIYMDYWPMNLARCARQWSGAGSQPPIRPLSLLLLLARLLNRLRQDTGLLMTDLKPGNILVRGCPDGPLTLALGDPGGLHRAGGAAFRRVETTPHYCAPELLDHRVEMIDETALVHSLGLIGYFILEGKLPWSGDRDPTAMRASLRAGNGVCDWGAQHQPELKPLQTLIEQCLRDRNQGRFRSFRALAKALAAQRKRWFRRSHPVVIPPTHPRPHDPLPTPSQPLSWREPITGMELVWMPGGWFEMGQSEAEGEALITRHGPERHDTWFSRELPRHRVELDGFWIGRYPVTRGQFARFATEVMRPTDAEREGWAFGPDRGEWRERDGLNWRRPGFPQEEDHPVVCVSWFDARAFIKWLRQRTTLPFGLPTEAQWEYACRAGSGTPYHWGETLEAGYANYSADHPRDGEEAGQPWLGRGTAPVGSHPLNAWGVGEMHGNVWEWCQDGFDPHFYATPRATHPNPLCTHGQEFRVRRGGSWSYRPAWLRAAYRGRNHPDSSYADIGFRLVLCPVDRRDAAPDPGVKGITAP